MINNYVYKNSSKVFKSFYYVPVYCTRNGLKTARICFHYMGAY